MNREGALGLAELLSDNPEAEKRRNKHVEPGISEQERAKEEIRTEAVQEARRPKTFVGKFFDIIQRGGFASAAFADTVLNNPSPANALTTGAKRALRELVTPVERLGYADVIRSHFPDFAAANPTTTEVIGAAGNIFLDPTTYLSLGGGGVVKIGTNIGVKALNRAGKKKMTALAAEIMEKEMLTSAASWTKAEAQVAKAIETGANLARKGTFTATKKVGFKTPLVARVAARGLRKAASKKGAPGDELLARLGTRGEIVFGVETRTLKNAVGKIVPDRIKAAASRIAPSGKTVEVYKQAVMRTADLPEEWRRPSQAILADAERLTRQVETDFLKAGINIQSRTKAGKLSANLRRKIGFTVKPDGTERITLAGNKIRDEVFLAQEAGRPTNFAEVEKIKQAAFKEFNLRPEEVVAYTFFRDSFDKARELELEQGLLVGLVREYWPRMWNIIKNPDDLKEAGKALGRMDPDFAQSTKFRTFQEGLDAGYVPELNAIRIMAQRVVASKRAMAFKHLEELKDTIIKGDFTPAQVKAVQADFRAIGESNTLTLNLQGLNLGVPTNKLARVFDFYNRIFKPAATVVNPGFLPFQAVSNTKQRFLKEGVTVTQLLTAVPKAARTVGGTAADVVLNALPDGATKKALASVARRTGIFDPTSRTDAAALIMHRDNPKILDAMQFRAGSGVVYSGSDVMRIADETGLIQGVAAGGVGFQRKLTKELMRTNRFARIGKVVRGSEGFLDLMSTAAKYWRFPQMLEDHNKLSALVSNLKAGHGPVASGRLAQEALFDYLNGLTKFENRWIKTFLMPFYSFKRFGIPLIMSTAQRSPGRLSSLQDISAGFFKAWGKLNAGEPLNPSERASMPGFLISSGAEMSRFEEETGLSVFNNWNNYSPTDAMGFLVLGPEGGLDMAKSVQMTILASMAGPIKIPIELAIDKNLFTDQAISEAREWQTKVLGSVAEDSLLDGLDATLPQDIKDILGWERGMNELTGLETIYINPTLAHVGYSSLPIVKKVLRALDGDKTPWEKFASLFLNVSTYKVDLLAQAERRGAAIEREAARRERDLSFATDVEGRTDTHKRRVREFNEWVEAREKELELLRAFPIRGKGLP
jgi:hypothetical protein